MRKFVMHNCLWLGAVHVHSSTLVLLVVCFAVMRGVQIRRGEGGKRRGGGGDHFSAQSSLEGPHSRRTYVFGLGAGTCIFLGLENNLLAIVQTVQLLWLDRTCARAQRINACIYNLPARFTCLTSLSIPSLMPLLAGRLV